MIDPHIIEVISNMRQEDRHEISSVMPWSWSGDMDSYLMYCIQHSRIVKNFFYEGRPVTTLVVAPMTAGVWNGASWSTDEWPRVVNQVTRFIRRDIPDMVRSKGCKMIDVWSLRERTDVNKWLALCNFVLKYSVNFKDNVFEVYRMEL